MGLAVCRKIVEVLRATSTPNEGATFWVTLPLTHSEQREKEGAEIS